MTQTTVLITGASRGLGKGMAEIYLARPSTTVIAAVRNPATATSLDNLPKGKGSSLIVVKIDSESDTDALTAIETLKTKHGIESLDIVIANAGIGDGISTVATFPLPTIRKNLQVNGIAPVLLFQAVFPLLKKGSKFMLQSTAVATISAMEQRPYPLFAYGASKAFANFFVRKIHFENEDLIAFAMDPGFAQTDMGNSGAKSIGMEKAYFTVEETVAGIVKQIDEATREKTGGHFAGWTGEDWHW